MNESAIAVGSSLVSRCRSRGGVIESVYVVMFCYLYVVVVDGYVAAEVGELPLLSTVFSG